LTPIRAFLEKGWKSRLACDLEDFDFLHCELLRAREEVLEGGVVRVRAVNLVSANVSATVTACAAVIANHNAAVK
jgi:hypothetical protein